MKRTNRMTSHDDRSILSRTVARVLSFASAVLSMGLRSPSSGRTVASHCFPDRPGVSDRIDPIPRIAEARVLFDVNESAVVT